MPNNGPVDIEWGDLGGIDTHYGSSGPVPYTDPWTAGPDASVSNKDGGPTARVSGAAVPNGVLPVVYGRGRVQGTIFHYVRNGAGGGTFYVWICGGPIDSVVKMYSNGVEVSWPATYSLGPETPTESYVWTFTQKFPFVVWARIEVPEDNTEAIGPFSFEVKGRLCYDPRENLVPSANDFSGWIASFDTPTMTTGQTDPFDGTDATLLEWAGAGDHDLFTSVGLVRSPADPINTAIWLRAGPGSTPFVVTWQAVNEGPPQEKTTIDIAVTADRWIGPIDVTHVCTVSGTIASAGVYVTAVTAPKLLVYAAHVAGKSYYGGRCITTGTEIVPLTAWTRNLPLICLEILTGGPSGNPHSARIPFSSSRILIGSFGDAATIAGRDEGGGDIRWGLDIVFNQPGQGVTQALARARAVAPCDVYRQDDLWRCDIESEFGAAEIDFDTLTNCYPQDLSWEIPNRDERPARVRLAYADPDNNWNSDSAVWPPPDADVTELDEKSLSLDASASRRQMVQFAYYMWAVGKMKRFQLQGSPVAALAHRYQRVSAKSAVQLIPKRECVVVGLGMMEGSLEWTAQLRETDPSLFTPVDPGVPGSGGEPQPGAVVPPVVQPSCNDAFDTSWYPARTYPDPIYYPAAEWTEVDVGAWDDTKINDGDTGTIGGDFTPAANSEILLTFPSAKTIGGLRITLVANPAVALSGPWPIEADGTPVTGDFRRPDDHNAVNSDPGYWEEWDVVSATTLKLRKGSTTVGTEEITELQYREFLGNYAFSDHVLVLDHATGAELTRATASTSGVVTKNLLAWANLNSAGTTRTLDVDLVNVSQKGVRSIPVRVVHSVAVTSLDTPQPVRMLKVDHTTHTATWQLGCVYDDSTRYGAGYWALTNVGASPDLSKINDGITNVKAFDANAAGATTATLDITGEPKAFCAVDFIVPAGTKVFTDHTTSGSYPGAPSPTPGAGPLGVWAAEFWNGSSWIRPPQTIKTSATTVTYSGRAVPADYPSQGWTADKYQIAASRIRIEWDPQLYSTARDKWRVIQTTTDAIALDVYEIQWLGFSRWNAGVHAFGIYAGLVSSSAGGTQATDGGVITPTGKSVAIGSVPADPPTLNVDYSFTSASLAAGTVRRTAWPGATGPYVDSVGWLDEVTVIQFLESAEGPALTEGPVRFAWDYSYSYAVGLGE